MSKLLALPNYIQNVIAVVLLGVLVLAAYTILINPIQRTYLKKDQAHQAAKDRFERVKRLANSAPAIQANVDMVLEDERFTQGLLPALSSAQSTSAVQARIRKCIQQAGGNIRAISSLPSTDYGTLAQFGVSVTSSMSSRQFDYMLGLLEQGQPTLFIEAIDIQVPPGERRRSGDNNNAETELIFRMEIVGLARRGTGLQ